LPEEIPREEETKQTANEVPRRLFSDVVKELAAQQKQQQEQAPQNNN
jgi:hypothetical protein